MKILFLTSEPCYPPVNGVRVKSWHALRLMAKQNEVAVATLISPEVEAYDLDPVKGITSEVIAIPLEKRRPIAVAWQCLTRGSIYFMERFRCESFRGKVQDMIRRFSPDVIHCDLILMTQYRDCIPSGVGAVASINDSSALTVENSFQHKQHRSLRMRMYRKYQLHQLKKYEARQFQKFHATHTMTDVDAAYLRSLNPAIRTEVIPNGTDILPPDNWEAPLPEQHAIVVARLGGANVEALERVLDIVWRNVVSQVPDAVLHVVGRLLDSCGRLEEFAGSIKGVQMEGFVPELTDAYRMAGICIVPVDKNCGLINKAVEGMAAGLCVVGLRKAFEGIPEAVDGEHCLLADSYSEMGALLVRAMTDSELRGRIQRAAAKMAKQCYSWESRRSQYQAMYDRASQLAQREVKLRRFQA